MCCLKTERAIAKLTSVQGPSKYLVSNRTSIGGLPPLSISRCWVDINMEWLFCIRYGQRKGLELVLLVVVVYSNEFAVASWSRFSIDLMRVKLVACYSWLRSQTGKLDGYV